MSQICNFWGSNLTLHLFNSLIPKGRKNIFAFVSSVSIVSFRGGSLKNGGRGLTVDGGSEGRHQGR